MAIIASPRCCITVGPSKRPCFFAPHSGQSAKIAAASGRLAERRAHTNRSQTGADREVQRILMELLTQMDGFDQSVNVKV